nr:immunoglobulin heavy chain junction region [Macaca mulatta]MOV38296.1 immunoglobulin heavy chain junction region [Macaca mulatta]MOV38305.1 immunoglobulin heavy chain junction region [Macaca mulatta]MOV38839.1 immunoglobulin heavy chain junction region [Macaca mulatta]MOV38907.1 immunoglobulin heavy chain junction region [Macaca mulatta]
CARRNYYGGSSAFDFW